MTLTLIKTYHDYLTNSWKKHYCLNAWSQIWLFTFVILKCFFLEKILYLFEKKLNFQWFCIISFLKIASISFQQFLTASYGQRSHCKRGFVDLGVESSSENVPEQNLFQIIGVFTPKGHKKRPFFSAPESGGSTRVPQTPKHLCNPNWRNYVIKRTKNGSEWKLPQIKLKLVSSM